MEASVSQKRNLTLIIILAAVFLVAIAGGVFFFIDGMQVDRAVAHIDNMDFDEIEADKGDQYSLKGKAVSAEIEESLEDSVYHTPLGFSIVSHSSKWKGQKLVQIYNQLIENKHGEEMGYLSQIDLYGGEPEYSDYFDASGDRRKAEMDTYVYADARSIIPLGMHYNAAPVVSDITLYYMDNYDDPSEIATTLSHEYGHHFTIYYFMQDDRAVKDSEYYQLRDFAGYDHEIFYKDSKSYYENHMWDVYEIAAEDYVQLMGGPDTKRTIECMDTKDLVETGTDPSSSQIRFTPANIRPQENIFIPLAGEMAGLREYYYSFVGEENEFTTPLQTVDFGLKIEKKSNYGYKHYEITWTMPNTSHDVMYTLVCYDAEGGMYRPVRTVYGDEEPIARVGSVVARHGNWIRGWNDYIPDENRIFKLYMLLPDGRMIASDPFYVEF